MHDNHLSVQAMKNTIIIIIVLLSSFKVSARSGNVDLTYSASFLNDHDTVQLTVRRYGCLGINDPFRNSYNVISKNHSFHFHLTGLNKPQYFDLFFKNNRGHRFSNYIMMPGDSIDQRKKWTILFFRTISSGI